MRRIVSGLLGVIAAGAFFGFGCNTADPFTDVYAKAIKPTCTNPYCHYLGMRVGGPAASGLDMSSQTIAYWSLYDHLADGPSCASGLGSKRVVPFDPDNSILYQKVHSTNPCGARMPADVNLIWPTGAATNSVFSGTPLSTENQQLIYDWIKEGAKGAPSY
jgi:hypothetical protein